MKFISFDQFVKILESQQINEETSGEKDYGIFMKYTKSQINYYRRKSAYPKFKKAYNELSLDELVQKAEVDEKSDEYLTQLENQIKEKIKAEIENVNQENIPVEQKKVKRQQLRDQQAEALEQAKETLTDKIDTEKSNIEERIKADKQKITDRISEFDTDYPIEVDSLKKRWNEFKAEVDLKYAIELNNDTLKLKIDATTDTDRQKVLMQKAKEREQELRQEAQKEIATLRQEAKEAEQEMQDRVKNAPVETKEALDKIREFQEKLGKFMDLAGAYTEDSSDEDKDAILQARKEMNEIKGKLSAGLLKKAGMATDNNAEEMVSAFEKDAEDAINSFKEVKDLVALKKDNTKAKETELQVNSYKPWYRKSDGALNESISQKFSRLLNKKV